MTDIRQHLLDSVLSVVERLEGETPEDVDEDWSIFDDVLDITVCASWHGDFQGAEVTFTIGGPAVWAETARRVVVGTWGSERIERSYIDNVGLEDTLEDLWSAR